MAEEAAVENLAISRFFCHKCNLEINRVQPDYTCPTCQSGFIEVLENQPEPNDESDTDMDVVQPFDLLNDMLMGLSGGPMRRSHRGNRRRGEHRRGGRGQPAVPFENLIQDFIVNLTEVGLGGLGVTPRANGPVNLTSLLNPLLANMSPQTILNSLQVEFLNPDGLFLGNPGDYAWGREGLDAIVTQLLNQMDGNGPPPLAKEKIQEIPVSSITQDQVDSSLQCSVCWEDFKVNEPVRKLICEHVYHEPCIIPWLELHGTCPICRTTLSEEGHSSEPNTSNIFGAQNGYSLASFLRANTSNTDSSRASSTSSSTTDASISSTNSFNSNNMEMDFD